MSHHDSALDSASAYHQHVTAGITSSYDHLVAAGLARRVADIEFLRAAEADTAAERMMWLTAAHKARVTSGQHELAADVEAIYEQASSPDLPRGHRGPEPR